MYRMYCDTVTFYRNIYGITFLVPTFASRKISIFRNLDI